MQEQAKVFQWSSDQEHLSQNGDILLKWTLQTYIPAFQQASKLIEKNVRKAANQCDAQTEFPTVSSGNLSIYYLFFWQTLDILL